MPKRDTCFVLSPFREPFDTYYKEILQPAVRDAGFDCLRADEIFSARPIMRDIWENLHMSRVILAEMTGRNANVLYEVGLSHALGKPVVMITASIDDIPFDLRAIRCIVYQTHGPNWSSNLKQAITATINSTLTSRDVMETRWDSMLGSSMIDVERLHGVFNNTTFGALMLVAALAQSGGGPITYADLLIGMKQSSWPEATGSATYMIRECIRRELVVSRNARHAVVAQNELLPGRDHAGYQLSLTPLGKQIASLWKLPTAVTRQGDGIHVFTSCAGPITFPEERIVIQAGALVMGDVSGAVVEIRSGATIEGNVAGQVVEILSGGTIEGNVAGQQIIISKNGRLLGDIRAKRTIFEDGAYFRGAIDLE